jgi:hypothetical protein
MKIDIDKKTKGQLLICAGAMVMAIYLFIAVYENSLYEGGRGGFIFGLGLIFWGYYKIKGNKYTYKCKNCLKISSRPQINNEKCPFCGGEIEYLEDFYKRNPEFK